MKYDVRTSGLEGGAKVAVLLEWESMRLVAALRRDGQVMTVLLSSIETEEDIDRALQFIKATDRKVMVDRRSTKIFFEKLADKTTSETRITRGPSLIRLRSPDDVQQYCQANNIDLGSDQVSVEI